MITKLKLACLNRRLLGLSLVVVLAVASGNARAAGQISEEQYLAAMSQAMADIQKDLADKPKQPLEFSANLFYAHEAMIEHFPVQVLLKYADALIETGVQRVDINPGLYPWVSRNQASIEKYDALIAHLQRSGVKIAFNPQYSPHYHRVRSVREWQEKALPVYAELARRYQPDVFVVVHEPTTMAARMGSKSTPAEWREFARAAAQVVKRESPRTRIGAGGLYWEEAYFDALLTLDEIEVMTLDIYNLKGLPTYTAMIERARARGKPVYIEETWRSPYFRKRPGMSLEQISMTGVGNAAYTQLDIQWLDTIAAYASVVGLESITPFWTTTFFAYVDRGGDAVDPAYTRRVLNAIENGERTETFQAFRALVKKMRARR